MTWEEFINNIPPNSEENFFAPVLTDITCPECKEKNIYFDPSMVLTSIPPQYVYWCDCGWSGYSFQKWIDNPILKNF